MGEILDLRSSPLVILSENSMEIDREKITRETILFCFENIIKIFEILRIIFPGFSLLLLQSTTVHASISRPLNEAGTRYVENHSKNSYGPKKSDLGGRKCILGNYFIEYTSRTSCHKKNRKFRDPLDQ